MFANKDIKLVLFDIGNVLLKTIHGRILNNIYSKSPSNISREEFNEKVGHVLDKSFHGEISLDETWNGLFLASNIEDKNIKINIMNDIKVIRNEELIYYLKDCYATTNVKFGILSDLSQIGYNVIMSNYRDFIDIVDSDYVFISRNLNMSKTKSGDMVFNYIKKTIECEPEEVLLIDDSQNNIDKASRCGFNVIKYNKDAEASSWNIGNKELFNFLKENEILKKEVGECYDIL